MYKQLTPEQKLFILGLNAGFEIVKSKKNNPLTDDKYTGLFNKEALMGINFVFEIKRNFFEPWQTLNKRHVKTLQHKIDETIASIKHVDGFWEAIINETNIKIKL